VFHLGTADWEQLRCCRVRWRNIRQQRCRLIRHSAGRNHRKIAEFASHSDRIWLEDLFAMIEVRIIMAVQTRSRVGSIAPVSAFQVLMLSAALLAVVGPVGVAHAADCLTAPSSAAPPNSHWYYRTDRAQQRKCWYLRAADGTLLDDQTATTTQSVPSAAPYSLENFKAFIAQRGIANLSDKDVAGLYAEFLAWRNRPGNQAKQN